MTRYYRKALQVLQEKGDELDKQDIKFVRDLYPMFSTQEYEYVGDFEEVISQIVDKKVKR